MAGFGLGMVIGAAVVGGVALWNLTSDPTYYAPPYPCQDGSGGYGGTGTGGGGLIGLNAMDVM